MKCEIYSAIVKVVMPIFPSSMEHCNFLWDYKVRLSIATPKEVTIQLVHANTQILPKHVIASTAVMSCSSETVVQKMSMMI